MESLRTRGLATDRAGQRAAPHEFFLATLNGTEIAFPSGVPVNISAPGRNGALTFSGTIGQRITLLGTAGITGSIEAGCDVWASIVTPSNTTLTGSSTCLESGGFMDVKTLSATAPTRFPSTR